MKDCIGLTTTKFIYKNIITRFECPKEIFSNQGKYFINYTINELLTNFMIQNNQSSPHNSQENRSLKVINKIIERTLTKIISFKRSNREKKLTTILWAYIIAYKIRINKKIPFKYIYELEAMVHMEFQVPSL